MFSTHCSLLSFKQGPRSKECSAQRGYEEAAEYLSFDRHCLGEVCSGAK